MSKKKKKDLEDVSPIIDMGGTEKTLQKSLKYKINLKCKNQKQKELVHTIHENQITFVEGVFGVGKTIVINSIALSALKEPDNGIEKIILIFPTRENGSMSLGLLPGTLDEKLQAHSLNELESLRKILDKNGNTKPNEIVDNLLKDGLIEMRPISFLRGASFDNAFICVSEAEEFTKEELFLIISRFEKGKMVISGDPLQADSKNVKQGNSGLLHAMDRLKDVNGVGLVKFNDDDVVRNDILMDIYKKWK